MKWRGIVCLPLALLVGCATVVKEQGQVVLITHADANHLYFKTAKTELSVDGLNHTNPTLASGQATSQIINAGAGFFGVIGASIVSFFAIPHAATAAVVAPAVSGAALHTTNTISQSNTNKTISNTEKHQ